MSQHRQGDVLLMSVVDLIAAKPYNKCLQQEGMQA